VPTTLQLREEGMESLHPRISLVSTARMTALLWWCGTNECMHFALLTILKFPPPQTAMSGPSHNHTHQSNLGKDFSFFSRLRSTKTNNRKREHVPLTDKTTNVDDTKSELSFRLFALHP
jgi:hypothetical protein